MPDFENPYANREPPNPYASAAVTESALPTMTSKPERLRQLYLPHESSVKSLGLMYLLCGVVALIICSSTLVVSFSSGVSGRDFLLSLIAPVVSALVAILLFTLSFGLRKLSPWAKIVASVLSSIGMVAFPFGTMINGYFLYLLLSEKGKMVFSPEYKTIIQQTPHLKHKTWVVIWGLLIVLVAFALFGILGLLFAG